MPPAPTHYFSPQTQYLSSAVLQNRRPLSLSARGQTLRFATGEGTFSKKSLDAGSRLLIETLKMPEKAHFCDLGCGWGVVGAFAAASFPEAKIWACDINPRAAQLASWNFQLNDLKTAVAWCGDGLEAARREFFEVVACNPPVRAGNAAIERLFEGAFGSLKPGGALWVVLRTAQGAKSWQKRLATQFGECETVEMDAGYRILKATR